MAMEEFGQKFMKTYRRNVMVIVTGLILSVLFCVYQFYLKHYGAALVFACISFVNSLMFVIMWSVYSKTKQLFDQSNAMIDEIMNELERDGKI